MPVSKEEHYARMTGTPVTSLILRLGIPTIISMLVTNIYNMADTYFVGTIGTSASGATGVVFGLSALLQAFGFMFGHGAGSSIARKLGVLDVDSASEYASTSFFAAMGTGILILVSGMLMMNPMLRLLGSTETILPYARDYAFWILLAGPAMTTSCVMNNILRYESKAFFAMIGLTSGGILNIFLDYLMVSVLHMGIGGAGLATCISQYIGAVILLMPYLNRKTQSQIAPRYVTHDFNVLKNIAAVGSPSLARQGLNSLSTIVINATAGPYGDAAVAAMSIVNKITNFLFCVAIGIGQGFQPVSSFNFGAEIYSRVREGFRVAFRIGLILMLVLGTVSFLYAGPFVAFFRDDPQVIEIGTAALRWQAASMFLMPVTLYGNMLFQSIGQSATALLLASFRSGLILIPVLIISNLLFGLTGLEASRAVADVISSLLTIPFLHSFFKNLPEDHTQYPSRRKHRS
ncbi:MAG: MATE family efflux transporter [Solobacterium sp.]|nr:MATE family efflux transporter [Solobacterium sp.]